MKKRVISVTVTRLAGATVLSAALAIAAPPAFAQEAAPAASATAQTPSADQLEDQIEKKWEADATLKGAKIDVEVKNGVATLTGEAQTAAQKAHAAKLAKVDGINSVLNQIEVVRPGETASKAKEGLDKAANKTGEVAGTAAGATKVGATKAAEGTKKGVTTAGEKTGEALGTAAEKTGDAAKATGKSVSDGWITAKVKSKFVGDKVLKGSDISVSTKAGVVTLTGTVPSEAAREHATSVVKTTNGVKDIVDNLTLSPATP